MLFTPSLICTDNTASNADSRQSVPAERADAASAFARRDARRPGARRRSGSLLFPREPAGRTRTHRAAPPASKRAVPFPPRAHRGAPLPAAICAAIRFRAGTKALRAHLPNPTPAPSALKAGRKLFRFLFICRRISPVVCGSRDYPDSARIPKRPAGTSQTQHRRRLLQKQAAGCSVFFSPAAGLPLPVVVRADIRFCASTEAFHGHLPNPSLVPPASKTGRGLFRSPCVRRRASPADCDSRGYPIPRWTAKRPRFRPRLGALPARPAKAAGHSSECGCVFCLQRQSRQ